jgi:hypothetical protein
MLVGEPVATRQFAPELALWSKRLRVVGHRGASIAPFAGAATLVLVYALPGGAYDLVVRQELGALVWSILGIGVLCGVLPRSRPSRPAALALAALAAYAALTAASLAWTQSAERTTAELARDLGYAGLVALIAAALNRSTWRAAVMGLGGGALAVCALAFGSRLLTGGTAASALAAPLGSDRLSYPFGYWNALGAWGAMAITIAIGWSAHDSSRFRRTIVLGLVPLAAVTTYLTYSRAAVAGTAVGLLAGVALSRNRLTALVHVGAGAAGSTLAIVAVRAAPQIARGTGDRRALLVVCLTAVGMTLAGAVGAATSVWNLDRLRLRRRAARALALAGVAVAVLAAAVVGPNAAPSAWRQFEHPAAPATADPATRLTGLSGDRYDLWRSALDAFRVEPLRGLGPGTFELWWDSHPQTGEFVRNAHSLELENMAELGLPGLAVILTVMGAAAVVGFSVRRRCRRRSSAGLAAAGLAAFLVYLLQASVDWLWQSTAVTVLALGLIAAGSARLSGGRPRLAWRWRVPLAVLAGFLALVQIPGMVSTAEIRQSQAAERAGNAGLALSWASAAVRAEPWAADPYEQRGLVLEAAGRLGPADADLRRAVAREPTNFRPWLVLARIETERGSVAAALRDYAVARRLGPQAFGVR